jgi:hypothetical protein
MKTCEIEGCDGKHYAKGLCSKHYQRLWKGGDPQTLSRKELSLEERFRINLGPPDPVTGCIEWTGLRDKGYGQIYREGKMVRTHRLAWELKHGPIPKGMKVCHSCDNPPCCNDEHLYLGTDADNNADREAKGRGKQPKGEANGNSKLTEADVREIRRRLAAGEFQHVLALEYGVGLNAINCIKTGKTWKHL